jgi:hypothetical protein
VGCADSALSQKAQGIERIRAEGRNRTAHTARSRRDAAPDEANMVPVIPFSVLFMAIVEAQAPECYSLWRIYLCRREPQVSRFCETGWDGFPNQTDAKW